MVGFGRLRALVDRRSRTRASRCTSRWCRSYGFGQLGTDAATAFVVIGAIGLMLELAKERRNRFTLLCIVPLAIGPFFANQRAVLLELGATVTVLVIVGMGSTARRRMRVKASEVALVALATWAWCWRCRSSRPSPKASR